MSINYNLSVSTSRPWTLFKLLFKWKGSIWKSIFVELIVWLILYYILNFIYRFALSEKGQLRFESAMAYCENSLNYIPLSFMLGFFVTAVLNRWLNMYNLIGFIDNVALQTSIYVRGTSEEAIMYRRTIIRYSVLSQVMYFRDISMRVRRRFPTIDSVVEAGYLTPIEKDTWENQKFKYGKNWLFMQWALTHIYQARQKGYIESDYYHCQLSEVVASFRSSIARVVMYDMVPIPQVYPQLICMAVHTFFLLSLLSQQFIVPERATSKKQVDIYFPLNGVLQFIFYMGWMKIAEVMLNPLGEDDDDFETNRLIDRNIAVGLDAADYSYGTCPQLSRDTFYDDKKQPLYSEDARKLPNNELRESVSHVRLKPTPMKYINEPDETHSQEPLLKKTLKKKLSSLIISNSNKFDVNKVNGKPKLTTSSAVNLKEKIIEPPKKVLSETTLTSVDSQTSIASFHEDFHPTYHHLKKSVQDLRKGSTNLKEHPFITIAVTEAEEEEEEEEEEAEKAEEEKRNKMIDSNSNSNSNS